jgi:acetyl-CoA acyltransferase
VKAWPNEVMVAGSSVSVFGLWPDASLADLAQPTILGALDDAGIPQDWLQAAYVGNAFGGLMQGQEAILGQTLLSGLGIARIPVHNVKNACSSGADAAHLAWAAVAYGQYDCVLVVGVEKMSHAERGRALTALTTVSDRRQTDAGRSVFIDLNVERAKRYMARHGATPRHFAACAVKNHGHALNNERAAVRKAITLDEVLADRMVAEPLTRAMCGGISDGAASLVLVSAAFARRHGLSGPTIVASAVVGGDPAQTGEASATRRAGSAAFEQSGVLPSEISLAEVHDPVSPQEFLDIEELGLCEPGGAIRLLEDGDSALGGRLPINVSGGLTCRGHPVGATGVAQIAEVAQQLLGRAGKNQVQGARFGLAQMAGGLVGGDSAVAAVHLLRA